MKSILITCDSCNKTVPMDGIKGWWGHKKSSGQILFAPYLKHNRKDFETGHACSEECLAKILQNYAATVDRKPVKQRASALESMFYMPSRWMNSDDDTGISDSIGYNKKDKPAEDEDE